MLNKLKSIMGSGFYVTLALCVAVVGVGGYFLLFDRDTGEGGTPQETEASAPDPTPPTVETVAPNPIPQEPEDDPVTMPTVEVPHVPVVAEAPHLIVSPLQGETVAAFSMEDLVYNETLEDWRTHDGIDIAAEEGTSVLAACSGYVTSVTDDILMGTTVVLEHDGGYETTYANLQAKPPVAAGDRVSAGQILGAVGSTGAAEAAQGPHLHFSVTKNGDTMDPNEFLES